MCRPTHYRIAYEINPWMRRRRPVQHHTAQAQWRSLHTVLTEQLGLDVSLIRPVTGLPDLVFTANAGLVVGRTVIRSNFRHRQRQGEEPVFERWFRRHGYRVATLPPRQYFEGEGDALFLGETLFFGFRFRSEIAAHETIARLLGARVLSLELADRRFYHLDTCFAPLDRQTALYYPGAFDTYGRRVIRRFIPRPIAVSETDALRFVCNTVVSGRRLVMPTGVSAPLRRTLTQLDYQLFEVELGEFIKAGGAAKCLVLYL